MSTKWKSDLGVPGVVAAVYIWYVIFFILIGIVDFFIIDLASSICLIRDANSLSSLRVPDPAPSPPNSLFLVKLVNL